MSRNPKHLDEARCFVGGPLSSKTARLVEQADVLLERGEDSLIVFCANDWLVQSFAQRLDALRPNGSGQIVITTPRSYIAEILSDPVSAEITGRSGRILEPYEEKLFFEDMRTITMKGRRLREMLGFIYRQQSELNGEDDWDATFEERQVLEYARGILKFTGGILASEAPGLALDALESDEGLRRQFCRSHVIVDDYNQLARGAQVLATRLASESIAIAADETNCGPACDPHPYGRGLAEFLAENPRAQIAHVDRPGQQAGQKARMLESLRQAMRGTAPYGKPQQPDSETGEVATKGCADMGEELRTLALIARDAEREDKTLLICGTNRVWRANVQRALASVGFEPHAPEPPIRVRDFSDEKSVRRALSDARRRLLHDPHDGPAWRSIVGMGDYVARSDALLELREKTEKRGSGIEGALEALASGEVADIDAGSPAMNDLIATYQRAKDALASGSWRCPEEPASAPDAEPWQKSRIIIANPRGCYGLQADIVVFGGFVNGLIPSRDYFDSSKLVGNRLALERQRCLQGICLVAGRARERLVFTWFDHASLETAERLGLHIERIKLRDGVRMCSVKPSAFLKTLGLSPA